MSAVVNEPINAMTVDVEDYFQVSAFEAHVSRDDWDSHESRVVRNTERLLEIFAEARIAATFFVLGWVAAKFPALVRQIVNQGHEVASHGFEHRLVYQQGPKAFREDIRRARGILETTTGQPVVGYRAPSYSITKDALWALDILVEERYLYDASIFPIRHDRYGIPGWPRHLQQVRRAGGVIWEFPTATVRLAGINLPVGGGGYFRLLPYRWTQLGIARVNQVEAEPAMFYLHPWEIDPDQPRLAGSALSRFRHYRNLTKTALRLRALLTDFRFGRVVDLVRSKQGTARALAS